MTTLPCDLAKRLKEAGWPQIAQGGAWLDENGIERYAFFPYESTLYSPSLPELIGACEPERKEGACTLHLTIEIFSGMCIASYLGEKRYSGATPEIAVAELWLGEPGARKGASK